MTWCWSEGWPLWRSFTNQLLQLSYSLSITLREWRHINSISVWLHATSEEVFLLLTLPPVFVVLVDLISFIHNFLCLHFLFPLNPPPPPPPPTLTLFIHSLTWSFLCISCPTSSVCSYFFICVQLNATLCVLLLLQEVDRINRILQEYQRKKKVSPFCGSFSI